jgi:septal ring factor EnvC (AmiA/AmiB activator)
LPQDAHAASRPPRPGDGAAPLSPARVVSVSPLDVEIAPAVPATKLERDTTDRQSFDLLHDLIANANAAAERLERAVAHASQREAQTANSAGQLQERLQLSAQMLKAFQSQITRIEAGLGELRAQEKRAQVAESRVKQRVMDAEARIDAAIQRFSAQVEQIRDEALARITIAMQNAVEERAVPKRLESEGPTAIARDLVAMTAALQQVAERIGDIAQTHLNSAGVPAVSSDSQPAAPLPAATRSSAPDEHAPPLRFQNFAGAG